MRIVSLQDEMDSPYQSKKRKEEAGTLTDTQKRIEVPLDGNS